MDVDAFGVNNSLKDGKFSRCKECQKAKNATYFSDPEVKARKVAYDAARRADPEVKARNSAIAVAYSVDYYAKPEVKARIAAYDAVYSKDPEVKARKARTAISRYYRDNPNAIQGAYGYRTDRTGFVYVVSGRGLLKVGITNNRDQRLSKHNNQGLTDVVHVWEFPDGADALAIEQIWKEHLETLPRVTKKQLKDGYTEATYDTDAVGDWIVQNLEPLALSA